MLDIIKKRHCQRAFLDQAVPKKLLENILLSAGNAASSKNSQPWQVAVLQGHSKDSLIQDMCEQFDSDRLGKPDYQYMTDPMPEIFKTRARECGYGLYQLKQISRDDHDARRQHFRENYTFFGAPVGLIFHLHSDAERGNFLDMGLFMQNIMLGLVSEGLGSCPQFSITMASDLIRQHLNLGSDRMIVCGMAVGYPTSSDINMYIPERLPLSEYVQWFD